MAVVDTIIIVLLVAAGAVIVFALYLMYITITSPSPTTPKVTVTPKAEPVTKTFTPKTKESVSLPIYKIGDEVKWHSRGNGRAKGMGKVVDLSGKKAVINTGIRVVTRSTDRLSPA